MLGQGGDVGLGDLVERPLVGPELQYRLLEAGGAEVLDPAAVGLGVARGHAEVRHVLKVLLVEVVAEVPGVGAPVGVLLPGLCPPLLARLSPPPFSPKRIDELVNI